MRKMALVELGNASLNTPTDEKKAAIIESTAAQEMQKTWDHISHIIVRAEDAGIRVPTKLRHLQLLWPRESSTALSEFLTFEHKAQACPGPDAERYLRLRYGSPRLTAQCPGMPDNGACAA